MQPCDLGQLKDSTFIEQNDPQFCHNPSCSNFQGQVRSNIKVVENSVTIVWLSRCTSQGVKKLGPILRPSARDWAGKRVRAVLAHEGINPRGGHWVAFVHESNDWWRVDCNPPVNEDPFLNQIGVNGGNYTIDIVILSSLL